MRQTPVRASASASPASGASHLHGLGVAAVVGTPPGAGHQKPAPDQRRRIGHGQSRSVDRPRMPDADILQKFESVQLPAARIAFETAVDGEPQRPLGHPPRIGYARLIDDRPGMTFQLGGESHAIDDRLAPVRETFAAPRERNGQQLLLTAAAEQHRRIAQRIVGTDAAAGHLHPKTNPDTRPRSDDPHGIRADAVGILTLDGYDRRRQSGAQKQNSQFHCHLSI